MCEPINRERIPDIDGNLKFFLTNFVFTHFLIPDLSLIVCTMCKYYVMAQLYSQITWQILCVYMFVRIGFCTLNEDENGAYPWLIEDFYVFRLLIIDIWRIRRSQWRQKFVCRNVVVFVQSVGRRSVGTKDDDKTKCPEQSDFSCRMSKPVSTVVDMT